MNTFIYIQEGIITNIVHSKKKSIEGWELVTGCWEDKKGTKRELYQKDGSFSVDNYMKAAQYDCEITQYDDKKVSKLDTNKKELTDLHIKLKSFNRMLNEKQDIALNALIEKFLKSIKEYDNYKEIENLRDECLKKIKQKEAEIESI